MPRSSHRQMREQAIEPTPMDVLLGRGRGHLEQPGNKLFRDLVNKYAPTYNGTESKHVKSRIVGKVVEQILQQGRFLKQVKTSEWVAISEEQAKDKIGHAMRYKYRRGVRMQERAVAKEAAEVTSCGDGAEQGSGTASGARQAFVRRVSESNVYPTKYNSVSYPSHHYADHHCWVGNQPYELGVVNRQMFDHVAVTPELDLFDLNFEGV
jgi:hypothetical protein